jgi:hypothetical protein
MGADDVGTLAALGSSPIAFEILILAISAIDQAGIAH